jgi:outer membrane protein
MKLSAPFATLALACALSISPARAEDLITLLQLAIDQDPTLAQADATKRATDQGVGIERAALLPQATLTQNLTDTHGGTLVGSLGHERERDLGATVTQTLFSLPDIAALREARATAAAGDETLRAARLDLYMRVAQAYFDVLVAQDQVKIYNAYEDAYRREYDQTRVRFEQGLSAEVDMNQAKAYYLNIKSERIGVANTLETARQALAKIIGRPPGQLATLREDFPMKMPSPANVEAWVAQAEQHNADIGADTHSLRAAEHAVTAARGGHLPTLTASFSYGKTGAWYTRAASDPSYARGEAAVGLALSFPLFSGGQVHAQVRQTLAQRDEAASTLEIARRQAYSDVRSDYKALEQGVEQVEAAHQATQAAANSVRSMQMGYEIGTQSLTNLVVAISILADTQNQYSNTRHQFVLNLLGLKQAAGVLAPSDLEEINRWLQ